MKKTIFAAAMVLGFGALAHAADTKYQVGLGLLDSLPMSSDFRDVLKSSLGFNAYGDYAINDTFAAGVEIGDVFGYPYKGDTSVKLRALTYGVRGKIVKPMDFGSKKGNVYGIVGISSYRWSSNATDETTTKVGYNVGLGAQMEVSANWLVGLEARYHIIKIEGINANTLAPTLTVGYSF